MTLCHRGYVLLLDWCDCLMGLNRDITSKRGLHFKGLLFLILGCFAATMLICNAFSISNLALLLIVIWSFCRFYYFLFYVLENYAGRQRRYAGVVDALRYLIKGDEQIDPDETA